MRTVHLTVALLFVLVAPACGGSGPAPGATGAGHACYGLAEVWDLTLDDPESDLPTDASATIGFARDNADGTFAPRIVVAGCTYVGGTLPADGMGAFSQNTTWTAEPGDPGCAGVDPGRPPEALAYRLGADEIVYTTAVNTYGTTTIAGETRPFEAAVQLVRCVPIKL